MNLILARALDCAAERCRVQPLNGGDALDAPLAAPMIAAGTRIRPGMIVALDRDAETPTIRWRFETRPVEALAGDRLIFLGRQFRFTDARPADERAIPIRVGDTVVSLRRQGGDDVEIVDLVVDGRPLHPERLEAEFPRIESVYREAANA